MRIGFKKFIAIISSCALFMCSPIISAYADQLDSAEEELTDGTFTYELVNGSYTITKCESTAIVTEIPEIRNGYAVTAIGDYAFAECNFISELKIPSTIKSIGLNAFAYCTSLKSVTLPEKITEIPFGAFMGCTLLESVDIPDSVKTIENYAFYNCSALKSVTLSSSLESLGTMVFAECSVIEDINTSDCDNYTFEDGILYDSNKTRIYRASTTLSGEYYISDTVNSIEPGAFSVCTGIEKVYIPASVSYIGEDAFGYCVELKKIDFSEGLTSISPIAFKYCTALESADLPTSLEEIGEGAFYNCQSLTRVILPEGIKSIGMGAFLSCDSLEQAMIPQTTEEVGDYAFGFYENTDTGEYTAIENFELSVYSGSAGESYAKSNKISYTLTDKNINQTVFLIIGIGAVLFIAVFAVILMSRGKKAPPAEVKRADKIAKEQAEDDTYTKILDEEK